MTRSDKPKEIEIYHDDHELRAVGFYEEFMKKNGPPALLLSASKEFELSSNPEGKQISTLCRGLYFKERGIQEKDHKKAGKLLLKSMSELKKVGQNDDILKKIELEFLKRKMLLVDKNLKKPPTDLILRRAKILKSLGRVKEYHLEMALFYMFYIMENLDKLPREDILKNASLMLKHAEKGEEPEQLYKTKALYHQIRAKHVFNYKQSLTELESAAAAIRKTTDKYGEEITRTEIKMTKAMITAEPIKRTQLLKEVAKEYSKSGESVKENFVRQLLRPAPSRVIKTLFLVDKSIEKFRELEKKIIENHGNKKGPAAVFYHLGYMLERIEDVKRLLVRMASTRKALTELHIKENSLRPKKERYGKPYSKELQGVFKEEDELRKQIKQDAESLYIFGNLLLDQWSYVIGYIAGYEVPKGKSGENPEFNFDGLVNFLQKKNYQGELSLFWDKNKKDLIWLYYQLRFFRNTFVEHIRKPWQRGNTMGVYGDDFSFHIPAPVGYIKPSEEKKMLKEIYPLAPKKLRDMPADYWEKKNLRRVLEVTLNNIDTIEEQVDRDKVWQVWNKLGGSTPSYDIIGLRLFNYVYTSIETMLEFIDKYPKQIKFGKFEQQGD